MAHQTRVVGLILIVVIGLLSCTADEPTVANTPESKIDVHLVALEGYLVAADMVASPPRYTDQQLNTKLQEMLGGEPAPEILSWFRFAERWRLRMVEPSMSGVFDIDRAFEELNLHAGFDVEDSGLIVSTNGGWDLVAIGAEPSGSIFVVSPATIAGAATDEPRISGFEFGESFFFHDDGSTVRTDRNKLPTLYEWLSELVAAHQEGRIVSVGNGGFDMADADGTGQIRQYPWPLLDSD